MNPTPSDFSQACAAGRIEQAVGVPWVALGRDLTGFDCWGFVRYALDLTDAQRIEAMTAYFRALAAAQDEADR